MSSTSPVDNPLQNILLCMDAILESRRAAHSPKQDKLYCMVGEADHMAEIHKVLWVVGLLRPEAEKLLETQDVVSLPFDAKTGKFVGWVEEGNR